ncbi:MAG TPA: ankyrin repeat domain-containing protein, partial [Terriglobales bacterium]|nr:ankyrin repeat domain-containing protein [Terriglobales bacterium]
MMLGFCQAVGCCLLVLLAGVEAQVNPTTTACPSAIPQDLAKLTPKQKLAAALFAAVEDDDLRAVKRLLAQHTDADARDLHCSTPLMFAVVNDDTRVAE